MKSTQEKVEQLSSLLGAQDLSTWEKDFVKSIKTRLENPKAALSEKQLNVIEKIYEKHFA